MNNLEKINARLDLIEWLLQHPGAKPMSDYPEWYFFYEGPDVLGTFCEQLTVYNRRTGRTDAIVLDLVATRSMPEHYGHTHEWFAAERFRSLGVLPELGA